MENFLVETGTACLAGWFPFLVGKFCALETILPLGVYVVVVVVVVRS